MNTVSLETQATAASPASVKAAYAYCQEIAKREAKNFYYSFRVLPQHKRDAMCAIYAFMRRADDIADEESILIEERRAIMSKWLAAWRASTLGDANQVFVAVRDTQARFAISDKLLEQLVQGTTMDLEPAEVKADGLQTFQTFDELYQYCYLVASVVGLVCIRIFGYSDTRAELLAEKTGIAFQLTNILRDIKEDADRGRVYLPLDRLRVHDLAPVDIVHAASGSSNTSEKISLLVRDLSRGAHQYYKAAEELIPLIDIDSRAALWVLVKIYSRLLDKIDAQENDLLSQRVSVSTAEKLSILAQGSMLSLWNRISG